LNIPGKNSGRIPKAGKKGTPKLFELGNRAMESLNLGEEAIPILSAKKMALLENKEDKKDALEGKCPRKASSRQAHF
jgi:hypothetical protein